MHILTSSYWKIIGKNTLDARTTANQIDNNKVKMVIHNLKGGTTMTEN